MKTYLALSLFSLSCLTAFIVSTPTQPTTPKALVEINDNLEKRLFLKAQQQAWEALISGQHPQFIQELLQKYVTASLALRIGAEGFDYESVVQELLHRFPNSPEYLCAIGMTYSELPHNYLLEKDKYIRISGYANNSIYDPTPDNLRSLQYIYKAYQMALKQGKNNLAAQYAFTLSKQIKCVSDQNIDNKLLAYQHLSTLTNWEDIPPIRNQRSYSNEFKPTQPNDFTPYPTPSAWDEAKNNGERIMWLLNEAKNLDPALKTSIDYYWADIIRQTLNAGTAIETGDILRNDDITKEQAKLKDNQYLLITRNNNVDQPYHFKIITLEGMYNYIHVFRTILQEEPDNSPVGLNLANELWNRSQFNATVTTLEQLKSHINTADVSLETLITHTLNDITSPSILTKPAFPGKIFATVPEEGIKIPVAYRNSPTQTWHIVKIDLTQLTREELNELLRCKTERRVYNALEKYSSDGICKLIQAGNAKVRSFTQTLPDETIKLTSTRPYAWQESEVTLPISKAGTYLIFPKNEYIYNPTFVEVNPLSYYMRQTTTGYQIFLFERDSGKPVPGAKASIYAWIDRDDNDRYETETYERVTDENGMCSFDIPLKTTQTNTPKESQSKSIIIGAILEKDSNSIAISPNNMPTWDKTQFTDVFSQPWTSNYYMAKDSVSSICLMSQPIYRPNDTIEGKLVISQYNLEHPSASSPAGVKVAMRVINPMNNRLGNLNQDLILDEFGTANFSINLPPSPTLGSYRLEFTTKDATWVSKINVASNFRLEEFVKPDFLSSIKLNDSIEPKKPFTLDFGAEYYAGGPVSGATVNYTISLQTTYNWWRPITPWSWLIRTNNDNDFEETKELAQGELTLDSQGKAQYLFTPPENSFIETTDGFQMWQYTVSATITDTSGKTIEDTAVFPIGKYPFNVEATTETNYANQGESFDIKLEATTSNGTHIPHVKGTLSLVMPDPDHKDKQTSPKDKTIDQWDVSFNDLGVAHLKITPKVSGKYELRGEWKNQSGSIAKSSKTILIAGDKTNSPFGEFNILPNKVAYQPDEDAKLLITTKQPHSYVYIFPRSGWPNQSLRVIKVTDGQQILTLPTSATDRPNFDIKAIELGPNPSLEATAQILIPPENTQVIVEIASNEPHYQPGAKGSVKIKVTLPNGQVAPDTQVTLAIYDESLEYFKTYDQSSLLQTTWGRLNTIPTLKSYSPKLWYTSLFEGDQYRTKRSFILSQVDKAWKSEGIAAAPAAFGADKHLEKASNIPLRDLFKDSLKWIGSVQTDAHGEAIIPISLPDNLTTWKMKAWARTSDLRVGEQTGSFICAKELMINPNPPRFLVQNDQAELSGLVRNRTDKPMELRVSLENQSDCIEIMGESSYTMTIPAQGQLPVNWQIKATQEGQAVAVMKAIGQNYSDAVEMKWEVLVDGAPVSHQESAILNPNEQSATLILTVPQKRRENESSLKVNISPSLALMMVNAVPYLTHYKHQCSEQTANRFAPTMQIISTLTTLGYSPQQVLSDLVKAQKQGGADNYAATIAKLRDNPVFNVASLNEIILQAVKRLQSLQLYNGGWGWFTTAQGDDPLITLYVVDALQRIQGNKEIDAMLSKAQDYLVAQTKRSVSLLKKGELYRSYEKLPNAVRESKRRLLGEYQLTASAEDALLYSLVAEKNKAPATELERFIWRDRYKLPIASQLLLANVYSTQKANKKVDELMPLFTQYLKQDDQSQLAWLNVRNNNSWFWYQNNVGIQASFLKLLVKTAAANSEEEKIMVRVAKWLTQNRSYGDYWDSTMTTGQVIDALCDYTLRMKEGMDAMKVAVYMDGKLKKTIESTKDTLFFFDSTFQLKGKEVTSGKHQLEFKRELGNGNIYAEMQWEYFSLEDIIPAAGNQVQIERNYYKLIPQGLNQAPLKQQIKPGDSVQEGDIIDVILIIKTKNQVGYAMVIDPLPAGFANVQNLSAYDWQARAYREIATTETRWAYTSIPHGTTQFTYQIRAQRTGNFSALPSSIEAMYVPELRGNSREDEIKVVK